MKLRDLSETPILVPGKTGRTGKALTIPNIEEATRRNKDFRRVFYSSDTLELTFMSIAPGDELGEETHHNGDQYIEIEGGQALVVVDDQEIILNPDGIVIIPAGAKHNVINTSDTEELKLYTLYGPPQHKEGTIHLDKADAEAGPD